MTILKKLGKHLAKHSLVYGLIWFFGSFPILYYFRGNYNLWNIIPVGFSWGGIMLILEHFTHRNFGFSYRLNTDKRKSLAWKIVLVSVLFTLILDIYGGIFPRLWVFKGLSVLSYSIYAIPAFILYSYCLLMLYRLSKFFLNKYIKGGRLSNRAQDIYVFIVKLQLYIGVFLFVFATTYLIGFIGRNSAEIADFSGHVSEVVPWWFPFAPMLSIYFIFEYVSFRQGKETLTRDFIRKDYLPYLSILISSIIGIVLIEFHNAPLLMWEYSQWPLSEIRIFEMPLLALVWWHTQFLALLAMLRVFIPEKDMDLW